MDKILSYTLREEDFAGTAGGLVNLVLKNCVRVTGHEISAAKFTEGGITCDGRQVRVTERMRPGQTLRVVLPEERDEEKLIPVPGPVRVLYEDEDLIAVDKAAGEVVHPGPGHYTDTIANHVTWYLRERSKNNDPAPAPERSAAGETCAGAAAADGDRPAQEKAPAAAQSHDETVSASEAGDIPAAEETASAPAALRVIGRLDKETSGVLLFAKSRAAAARLQRERREGTLVRTYLAVCEGIFPEKSGTIDRPVEKVPGVLMKMRVVPDEEPAPRGSDRDGQRGMTEETADGNALRGMTEDAAARNIRQGMREETADGNARQGMTENTADGSARQEDAPEAAAQAPRGLRAVTHYEVLGEDGGCSLLALTIETGRTHQIRVHLASIGHPLIGDTLYGSGAPAREQVKSMPDAAEGGSGTRALLHACELRLIQPFTGQPLCITSPVPEDFRKDFK